MVYRGGCGRSASAAGTRPDAPFAAVLPSRRREGKTILSIVGRSQTEDLGDRERYLPERSPQPAVTFRGALMPRQSAQEETSSRITKFDHGATRFDPGVGQRRSWPGRILSGDVGDVHYDFSAD